MRQTRVYLPLSRSALRRLASSGSLDGPSLTAFAVTEQLERAHPRGDEEDLEYLALHDAAAAALAVRERTGDRVVVAAADVEPQWVQSPPASDGVVSQVRITEPVPQRRVVSFHVDAVDGPATGATLELLWYDATELEAVTAMFR